MESEQGNRTKRYRTYRARPRFLIKMTDGEAAAAGEFDAVPGGGGRGSGKSPRRFNRWRALRWLLGGAAAWVVFSLVLFMISAQIESGKTSDQAKSVLSGGGISPTTANTILVLGSDQRVKKSKEPGADSGPSRSDTIMLLRFGGGHSGRLSIPRDTVVDIPGHGQDKINAAYAIGGPTLAITTVEQYLGIEINHLVEVNFENFPGLIDAMGGVNVRTGCVVSKINGGFKNGGFTLRLKSGKNHLNGKQALALARTRKNECNIRDNDLTRVKRQQAIFAAMKSRLLSPTAFVRLPWISWQAPRAIKTDMGGPSMLSMFLNMVVKGSGKTRILKPTSATVLPDGGAGLVVSEEQKRKAVEQFLDD